jgi:hypothetical protein
LIENSRDDDADVSSLAFSALEAAVRCHGLWVTDEDRSSAFTWSVFEVIQIGDKNPSDGIRCLMAFVQRLSGDLAGSLLPALLRATWELPGCLFSESADPEALGLFLKLHELIIPRLPPAELSLVGELPTPQYLREALTFKQWACCTGKCKQGANNEHRSNAICPWPTGTLTVNRRPHPVIQITGSRSPTDAGSHVCINGLPYDLDQFRQFLDTAVDLALIGHEEFTKPSHSRGRVGRGDSTRSSAEQNIHFHLSSERQSNSIVQHIPAILTGFHVRRCLEVIQSDRAIGHVLKYRTNNSEQAPMDLEKHDCTDARGDTIETSANFRGGRAI